MARQTALRASDADRDAVAERLRQAAVEGRLDPDELEQRLHTALRAGRTGISTGCCGTCPPSRSSGNARGRGVGPAAGFAIVMVTAGDGRPHDPGRGR